MSLAEKLISLRKQKGLTQIDLAEKLNVSRQAISRWEVGTSVPSTDNLKVLSELYGVSVDYLLKSNPDTDVCNESAQALDQRQNTHTASKKHVAILAGIIALLLAVCIAIHFIVFQPNDRETITPIGEMDSVVEDNSSKISFTIE